MHVPESCFSPLLVHLVTEKNNGTNKSVKILSHRVMVVLNSLAEDNWTCDYEDILSLIQ